jgi:hypothetical protein
MRRENRKSVPIGNSRTNYVGRESAQQKCDELVLGCDSTVETEPKHPFFFFAKITFLFMETTLKQILRRVIMKKIFSIFIIILLVGTMFAGCDAKEEVGKETDGNFSGTLTENILTEDILYENIITEDVID